MTSMSRAAWRAAGQGSASPGNRSPALGAAVADVTGMRHLAALAAALATANLLTGCILPGGCGIGDPTVPAYTVSRDSTSVAPPMLRGMAVAVDGVWMLEQTVGAAVAVEYDSPGGAEVRRVTVEGGTLAGLAWDGAHLWVGHRNGSTAYALELDPATGAQLAQIALPDGTTDLASIGTHLVAVQGLADIELIDPATGDLAGSIPVNQLDAVTSVAVHGNEIWIAQAGSTALVYGADGVLTATVTGTFGGHMAFWGDELLLENGALIEEYSVIRPATPAA
jgi:hypothetical protein